MLKELDRYATLKRMTHPKWPACLGAVAITALSIASGARASEGGVEVTSLAHTSQSWDGADYTRYPEGTPLLDVQYVRIPAHTMLPWHSHGVVNAVYLLSGRLTVEKKNGESRTTFTSGQVIADTVGTIHHGYTTDEPAEMVVFFAGAKGQPLRTLEAN
ncbi:cupin domain-containing protein [Burkholderia sp. AU31624]|uniref:cupin domain-containing protein n=1 Tax=Burkholderia TaxID=32008 RepID=UPI000B7AD2B2|nr:MULTISPECIES: cupin domain-containing protein [Burkholderia]MCA8060759.1 cupin domain-containing protein [Burkholderia sp. AU38729]MCA8252610.1 cupin domain-containing protein [Burkholderia sp. AU31624]OXI16961.1 cupin [Burkholderia sp. AU15512]VWD34882.1 cupin [Burkholderia contaminans]